MVRAREAGNRGDSEMAGDREQSIARKQEAKKRGKSVTNTARSWGAGRVEC